MRYILTFILTTLAAPVMAHSGHVAPQEGHAHWELYLLIAAVLFVGIAILRKRS